MKKCIACGHSAADHPEGFIGASAWTAATGDQPLCHTDDHSCYVAAQARGSDPLNVIDEAAYLRTGTRPNRPSR